VGSSLTHNPPDLTRCPSLDRQVQFQKVQQLRLTQSRAQYYGSLPNVNQIGNSGAEFQVRNPSV